jgi:hypothetical protein
MFSRRDAIQRLTAAACAAALGPRLANAQAQTGPPVPARVPPPSVISNPPRDFTPGAQPVTYPDPDVITIDPSFNSLRLGNTPIQRLWTGGYWSEGPAWCSSNAGNNVGYSGVTVHSPDGKLIGRIRLPEVCANVTFGGPKRNRLFMAAGQSLYAVYVNTQGASPG